MVMAARLPMSRYLLYDSYTDIYIVTQTLYTQQRRTRDLNSID